MSSGSSHNSEHRFGAIQAHTQPTDYTPPAAPSGRVLRSRSSVGFGFKMVGVQHAAAGRDDFGKV